jgi:hypothetical protein
MKCVFWFFLQLLSRIFLIIRTVERDIIINVKTCSCRVAIIFVEFWWNLSSHNRFSKKKKSKYQIVSKAVRCESTCFMRTNRRTDGKTDMKKLTVAFRNFANSLIEARGESSNATERIVSSSSMVKTRNYLFLYEIFWDLKLEFLLCWRDWYIQMKENFNVYCSISYI